MNDALCEKSEKGIQKVGKYYLMMAENYLTITYSAGKCLILRFIKK